MQTAEFRIGSGGGIALWRGIPAQITISGIEDVSGNWLFLGDNDFADGVILSGTVAAASETLVITLAEMNTVELADAIQGRQTLQCRATLTDGTSRVYMIPLTIKNRAVDGTPTPVSEYYTKAQVDALIAGLEQQGDPIVEAGTAIAPKPCWVYRHTLAENDEITIGTSGLSSSVQFGFELALIQPATPVVEYALPDNVWWEKDGVFDPDNPEPAMSEGDTEYRLVFRWDGANLLGNLAYSKAVTA